MKKSARPAVLSDDLVCPACAKALAVKHRRSPRGLRRIGICAAHGVFPVKEVRS